MGDVMNNYSGSMPKGPCWL